ncbi:MAG: glutamate-5-semialdehyde dehydrogenase [Verrucomicrobia bacterium]|nr:glutamate-5-semialdehyde dehydrogenase [Verrucomicrobiota bacterium]MCG2681072.1 glutamate-5-semialdehyde dehydrogenase [Kiritimatiellia bacterium]MBU4248301.1 glutamate-5-semialdehyde dehydrogenase [Verrucomicrobiota bacterium]MBU4290495.1 glutamate-5-semialdehyde dehydrogenase [Verrucomicrobiota bacterium]MBU4427878.1 glutamate-5-semialdehyde dehydrogenase [Verrucomicrobiota bacterium]
MSLHDELMTVGRQAVAAARALALLNTQKKNSILNAMADEILQRRKAILYANARDMEAGQKAGLSPALLDRLQLTDTRIDAMAQTIREVAALKDPVGRTIRRWSRPNGLVIRKLRVPIGVIGIIYESRPNITADAAVLCIKTSNAVILRGGKEAMASNSAIAQALQAGGASKDLPDHAVQLIQTPDHDAIRELVQMEGLVDLVMPRGGEALIRAVMEHARVPVIKHYKGVCHVFVDETANPDMALAIVENAKCQRPGICNAMETLLIHNRIAPSFLPQAARRLAEQGVELRGDPASRDLVPAIQPATEDDWYTEYLALILSVRIVPSVKSAIEHINHYGSHHSDAIVTESKASASLFTQEVDSAAVYVNASTRFTDGGEFGLGAEIGISTDKLHARGPMGLEELTTYKYVVSGQGQVRT